MKFKVGDKVRIRKDLKEGHDYKLYVNDDMEELAGEIVTITKVYGDCDTEYEINEDTGENSWTEDMFEGFAKLTKEELFAMPLGTIIKTDREEHNVHVKVGENDFCNDDADHIEYHKVNDDLSLEYFGNKIIEIQEPTYKTIYKADEEVKEMTIAEIEKELWYPIKVVKEEK